jgi:hypothetical protein
LLRFTATVEVESIKAPEGSVLLWFPASGIVAARALGFITGHAAKDAYARIDAQPVVPHEGFLDLSEAVGFDWEARMHVFQWNVRHMCAQTNFHILLVPEFLVATRVLAHLLGDRVEFHLEPASFASAYTLAVKRKSRSSPPAAN